MPLYTFFARNAKRKVTFIEQVNGSTLDIAIAKWSADVGRHSASGEDTSTFGEEITEVSDVTNIWCFGGYHKDGSFLVVHAIKTDES